MFKAIAAIFKSVETTAHAANKGAIALDRLADAAVVQADAFARRVEAEHEVQAMELIFEIQGKKLELERKHELLAHQE